VLYHLQEDGIEKALSSVIDDNAFLLDWFEINLQN